MAGDYKEYAGQRVTLTYKNDAGEQVTAEGRVTAGNTLGVIVKPKGKTTVEMIEADNIVSIEVQPEAPKKISQKKMKPIELSGVRAHLALYHGVSLDQVNAMTDEQGATYHTSLDHAQLGHNHNATEKDSEPQPTNSDGSPIAAPADTE